MHKVNKKYNQGIIEKKVYMDNKENDKIKFKELVSIMISQYLVILPVVFIVMISLMLFVKLLLLFWIK